MLECNNCGAKSSTAKLGEQHETNACRGYFTVPAPAPSTGTPAGGETPRTVASFVASVLRSQGDYQIAAQLEAEVAALRTQLAEAERERDEAQFRDAEARRGWENATAGNRELFAQNKVLRAQLAAQAQEAARLREAVVEIVWNLVWHEGSVFTVDEEAPDYPDEPLAGRVYDDIVKDRLRRRVAALAAVPTEESDTDGQ